MTVANAPIVFKVELQGLTAQPTMEAELVEAALTMKEEAVFFSNTMRGWTSVRASAACHCISIARGRCTSPATVPTFLAL